MITGHNAHNPKALIKRWRAVAKQSGLILQSLEQAGSHVVYFLQSPSLGQNQGLYISAGIHGDEPAGTEALITWAEKHTDQLATAPLLLFPCLNPEGLASNRRSTDSGEDLNRLFHHTHNAIIAAMKRVVGKRRFAGALMLHEDYDGRGIYLYELGSKAGSHGQKLLQSAARHIPIDLRTNIDGARAQTGLINRRFPKARFEKMGYPEAAWLHLHHTEHNFTIEAPSEFALDQRTRALVAVTETFTNLFTRSAR